MRRESVLLVARREVLERVRGRAFQVATAVLVAGVAAAAAAPHLLNGGHHRYRVGLAGDTAPRTAAALRSAAQATGDAVDVRSVATAPVALRGGSLDAVLVDGRRLVVPHEADERLQALVQSAVVRAELGDAIPRVAVESLDPRGDRADARNAAFGAAVLLYVALIFAGNWVASGIVEEKSGRVVEILLSAVRPAELLTGKLLGIGSVALAQVAAATAAGVASGLAVGSLHLPHGLALTAASLVGWFVLGYALYACAFAAAGSLVSRQEDVPAVTTPLNVVVAAGFLTAMSAAGTPDGTLARALSFLPPFSPLLMPVRIAAGDVPWWQPALAAVLALATLVAIVRVAARLYARSVLHAGARIPVRRALLGDLSIST